MKNGDGVVLKDNTKILERWKTYFEQLVDVQNERIERVMGKRANTSSEERVVRGVTDPRLVTIGANK